MSSNSGIPNESNLPDFTSPSIVTLLGVALGMVLLLVLLRKVISIFIIDMCLLGDCSSFKKIFCCFRGSRDGDRQNDMDNTGTSWPNRWRSRDAILFERIGAFNDPFAFIYGDKMTDEKRKKFLNIVAEKELKTVHLDGSKRDDLQDGNLKTDEQGKDIFVDEEAQREDIDDIIDQKDSCAETDSKNSGLDCSICLQGLDDDICEIRNCKHQFHRECIRAWITRSFSCPVCRKRIVSRDKLLDYMASNKECIT